MSSVPSLIILAMWWRDARDQPHEHPKVTRREFNALKGNPPPLDNRAGLRETLHLLADRRIALLALSYFLMNYIYLMAFWCFLDLVQERHVSLLQGGGLASLPFMAAAISPAHGGRLCDTLCVRYGTRSGMRFLPTAALPITAMFLVLTGVVQRDILAVAALSLASAFTAVTEGTFWTAARRIAPADVMASPAALNTRRQFGRCRRDSHDCVIIGRPSLDRRIRAGRCRVGARRAAVVPLRRRCQASLRRRSYCGNARTLRLLTETRLDL